ncbi:MAG: hypothetical protein IIB71_13600 [Proteobacteria bacterium]|nr:hypothetical protein [Pseudomonadota bacterium]
MDRELAARHRLAAASEAGTAEAKRPRDGLEAVQRADALLLARVQSVVLRYYRKDQRKIDVLFGTWGLPN